MKRTTILGICITALVVFAAWAPNANARSSFYNDECAGCHGGDYTTNTCDGCHAHGTHGDSGKNDININATPDSTTYNPGDTIVVQVGGGYRGGWVRVQMWDLDCSIANTCNQSNVLAEESLYTSGSEVSFPGPVALTATVPDTPGAYTWYAGWYGNERDTSTGSNASNLWIADSTNSGHGNELIAFTFTVTGCTVDLDCDDGSFCNGNETCDGTGNCQAGTPVVCDDGVGCTDDSCNETTDSCDYNANNTNCSDDGQFCTGNEFCDPVNDCSSTGDPCQAGEVCNEGADSCDQPAVCGDGTVDAGESCDDGPANGSTSCGCQPDCTLPSAGTSCADSAFCNGDETCDGAGACQAGTPVVCNDGVGCTDDSCDEANDTCVNATNDANCADDGLFCTGNEFCDAVNDCSATGDPCQAGETCNEGTDTCDTLTCADIADKGTCDADPNCQWVGKGKNGSCQDIAPAEDCADGIDNDGDGLADCDDPDCAGIGSCPALACADLDRGACQNDPTCEWSGKNKVCSDAGGGTPPPANCSDYNGDAKACRANGCSYSKKTETCS